jgi:phospholipase C
MRRKRFRRTLSSFVAVCFLLSQALPVLAAPRIQRPLRNPPTRSPIKHLIVVIGENRSFDNLFGTYTPPDPNQKVVNLLSEGIVDETGFPPGALNGNDTSTPSQNQATDTSTYELSPTQTGSFANLPQPSTGLNGLPASPCLLSSLLFAIGLEGPPTCSDTGLAPEDQQLLMLGGTHQPLYIPLLGLSPVQDCRYDLLQPDQNTPGQTVPFLLPNGPYPLVNPGGLFSAFFGVPPFDSTKCQSLGSAGSLLYGLGAPDSPPTATAVTDQTGDPVHRFFQMWQQADCSIANATAENPSGCLHDLVTWVAVTQGWGITGGCEPSQSQTSCTPPTDVAGTYQGGAAMGIYNMAAGDLPIFQSFAENYAINDNYHQPVMGGTGPNSQFIFTGDVYYFADPSGSGAPITPSADLISNPNPKPGSNNFYTQDTLPYADAGNTSFGGAVNCSDQSQPGVSAIADYESALPYSLFNNGGCTSNTYYQINNEYPAYDHLGNPIATSPTAANEFPAGPHFSIGPQTIPTIGDKLASKRVSWKYYGDGYTQAGAKSPGGALYCGICNGFQYAKSIMTTSLKDNIQDLGAFYQDVQDNQLPAVSFIKPSVLDDGHPGTSTPALFEAFVKNIVNTVQSKPKLWGKTAILVTFDESGGLYDSGYIQPIDFFGDGPRTVMIAISPFAKHDYVDHTYSDHASIIKFIEWNWRIKKRLSTRSRDNLPNPISTAADPYVPTNSPAIGNLTGMFQFWKK